MAVILDLKQAHSTSLTQDVNLLGASVDRVLNQFLQGRVGCDDYLTGCNFVYSRVV